MDSVASFLIQVLNGLQYGLLLFLVASGLTLIFGIMGVINLAHGSFYMIGGHWPRSSIACSPPSWWAWSCRWGWACCLSAC